MTVVSKTDELAKSAWAKSILSEACARTLNAKSRSARATLVGAMAMAYFDENPGEVFGDRFYVDIGSEASSGAVLSWFGLGDDPGEGFCNGYCVVVCFDLGDGSWILAVFYLCNRFSNCFGKSQTNFPHEGQPFIRCSEKAARRRDLERVSD